MARIVQGKLKLRVKRSGRWQTAIANIWAIHSYGDGVMVCTSTKSVAAGMSRWLCDQQKPLTWCIMAKDYTYRFPAYAWAVYGDQLTLKQADMMRAFLTGIEP